jgi:hypothetical protein
MGSGLQAHGSYEDKMGRSDYMLHSWMQALLLLLDGAQRQQGQHSGRKEQSKLCSIGISFRKVALTMGRRGGCNAYEYFSDFNNPIV